MNRTQQFGYWLIIIIVLLGVLFACQKYDNSLNAAVVAFGFYMIYGMLWFQGADREMFRYPNMHAFLMGVANMLIVVGCELARDAMLHNHTYWVLHLMLYVIVMSVALMVGSMCGLIVIVLMDKLVERIVHKGTRR